MKYFSAFSGIGGFELGMPEGAECVGYSEIEKRAIEVYSKHFPKHKNYGDLRMGRNWQSVHRNYTRLCRDFHWLEI